MKVALRFSRVQIRAEIRSLREIPKAGGKWSEKILHNFANLTQGPEPIGNLTLDSSANLYGAAGVIFEISP